MYNRVRDIITKEEGTLLESSDWSWKDVEWDNGKTETSVPGWRLELIPE